jgi:RNase adaptor protein for sRNA GlmZ degradation
MKSKAIFITGSSGVGKSTVVKGLREKGPEGFEIFDFDELGVPLDADTNWRIETTGKWLDKVRGIAVEGKILVVVGLTQPDEVEKAAKEKGVEVSYCMLEADEEELERRLKAWRFSTPERIASLKKYEGVTVDEYFEKNRNHINLIKKEAEKGNAYFIDTTHLKPDEVARKVLEWLNKVVNGWK